MVLSNSARVLMLLCPILDSEDRAKPSIIGGECLSSICWLSWWHLSVLWALSRWSWTGGLDELQLMIYLPCCRRRIFVWKIALWTGSSWSGHWERCSNVHMLLPPDLLQLILFSPTKQAFLAHQIQISAHSQPIIAIQERLLEGVKEGKPFSIWAVSARTSLKIIPEQCLRCNQCNSKEHISFWKDQNWMFHCQGMEYTTCKWLWDVRRGRPIHLNAASSFLLSVVQNRWMSALCRMSWPYTAANKYKT